MSNAPSTLLDRLMVVRIFTCHGTVGLGDVKYGLVTYSEKAAIRWGMQAASEHVETQDDRVVINEWRIAGKLSDVMLCVAALAAADVRAPGFDVELDGVKARTKAVATPLRRWERRHKAIAEVKS